MSIRRPTFATPVAMPVAALVALLLAVLWLAWQTAPALAVANALDRILAGTAASRDLDTAALPTSLAPQIERILADEQATARRWAAAGTAMRGTAAAFHLVASLPVLVMEPLAPRAAASVKRTQAALRPEPAPPPPDTAPLAQALASRLARTTATAALLRAAFARAPENWPDTAFGQILFVRARLQPTGADTLELPLEPAGIAFGWRNRLTVLQFRRSGPWQWTLDGIRLPPSPHHARALLDAAQPVERQASTP
ncbi:MAG: hypothetical protein AB1899_03080 [Pseudomonadota bacterium]